VKLSVNREVKFMQKRFGSNAQISSKQTIKPSNLSDPLWIS